ncbi:MAG TPA: DEAD/DEAH box helicase [Candidatus Thermoplasmatota archaeon]|nr:DEAD/DEAH box helicase [Candidatus Thermoplasmatota archaeon]
MALQDLGIDPRVAALLEAQGIKDLYPPQKEAWARIATDRNTVAAIPTASGKSLLAYLAILHRWLRTGRKALYIVPLRALASEKFEELSQFKPLGLSVGLSTGDLDERDLRLGRFDVIVCTSEKADALMRHRAAWIEEVGCVVADELHLLNDPGRGPTLEVTLTRFRAIVPDAQLVGLSATVANARQVAEWLDADLVVSDWRPVKLSTGTYLGDQLQFLDQKPRTLAAGGDPVTSLVEETIKGGGQCLVFVSTRKSAEAQAQRLAGPVRDLLRPEDLLALEAASAQLEDGGEGSPTGKKLHKLARAGVAYHTAGLDGAQRRFVEKQFRAGLLKVLCATPTLAAGVNTPARRVIVRDLTRFEMGEGSRPLPVMEVRQMMGRAGRPRYDPYGEAVLLVKSEDHREQVEETYLRGDVEAVTSKLAADASLRTHVLASIAGGYCTTLAQLEQFFQRTFWATETSAYLVRDRLEDVLAFLQDNDFVEPAPGSRIKATPFGARTSDLYLDPFSALRMRAALTSSAKSPSPWALLQAVSGCPDLFPLYLRAGDDWVQERFWMHHEDMLVAADGRDLENALSYAKTAFLLEDWMAETHLDVLEERYVVGPGDIRMRLDNAQWLLHGMRELARSIRPDWVPPLTDLGLRLEHGVKEELLPLIRLKGVGRIRARTLHANGFRRPGDLKPVPASRLAQLPGFGPKLAADILAQVGGDPGQEAPQPEAAPPTKGKGQATMADFGT